MLCEPAVLPRWCGNLFDWAEDCRATEEQGRWLAMTVMRMGVFEGAWWSAGAWIIVEFR